MTFREAKEERDSDFTPPAWAEALLLLGLLVIFWILLEIGGSP